MDEIAVPETTPELEAPLILTDDELLEAMLFQTLADGLTAPRPLALAKRMERLEDYPRIKRILSLPEFHVKLLRHKKDLVAYTTDQIKAWLPGLARKMLALAQDSEDSRTQFAAIKDLMDRGGTGAAQKVSLSTPSAYQQAIADLVEPIGTPDTPPDEDSQP